MKRFIVVSLFVLILQFGAFAQGSEFDLGMSFAKIGDFQKAVVNFQNSLDKNLSDKKLAQIHYNIGVCFYQLKQTNAAVTEYKQAVKLNPNYERAFYALGMVQADLKNFSEAEIAFLQSLKLADGRNGETWFDLAFVYVEQKKYDEAFASFQKAIKFGSGAKAASHNNLGVVYVLKGEFELAKKEIEIAAKLDFPEAKTNLELLQRFLITRDKSLIAKINMKENIDER